MAEFDPLSVRFFKTPTAFRNWLKKYHDKKTELFVGFYKKATELASITWPESVDEALCFGWIDGIRRSLDDKSYCIRFTPRRKGSHWSAVNIERIKVLSEEGRIQLSGMSAYADRKESKTARTSYEQNDVVLLPSYEHQIKKNAAAWEFFQSKSATYRKQCTWWIMSAKKGETQVRRLKLLIYSSSDSSVIPPLKWTEKKK